MKTISRPVINRLPVDVNQLDEFACRQLDRVSRSFLDLLFFSFFRSATIAKKKKKTPHGETFRFFKLGIIFPFPLLSPFLIIIYIFYSITARSVSPSVCQ